MKCGGEGEEWRNLPKPPGIGIRLVDDQRSPRLDILIRLVGYFILVFEFTFYTLLRPNLTEWHRTIPTGGATLRTDQGQATATATVQPLC